MSQTDQQVKMRVNVSGFGGGPISMFCAFDPRTDILYVGRVGKAYEAHRREGFLCITMQSRDEAHDAVFTQDQIRDAIRAFFEMRDLKLLDFGQSMEGHNPAHRIEPTGMDEHGISYSFDTTVTNGMVAVVIAAFYANQQRTVNAASEMTESMLLLDGDYDEVDDMHKHWG